jgi:ATP-dependent DNA helicase RecQ
MTSAEFAESDLRLALSSWPDSRPFLEGKDASDTLLDRIRQSLIDLLDGRGSTTLTDLIALLRHWLLAQARHGTPAWLRVSLAAPWPGCETWREQGFEVADLGIAAEIRPVYPRLSWLDEQHDLFDDAFNGVVARLPTPVPADPPVKSLLNIRNYTGPGQREAIRALLHLADDVTLIANLPTGSGKSLLAQIPPLLGPEGALTLVIVPTVALAVDQARRMALLLDERTPHWNNQPLAFHSGLSAEKRSGVFQALRSGEQQILFTSPEAATGSLRSVLLDCARKGRISHVVIDEAHLVVTWGSGFRPAFQLLPALISIFRQARDPEKPQPIRIVLASATLTPHTVTSLRELFSGASGNCIVSGIYLRPEPRYAMRACASINEKTQRVLEAVMNAPRPFILYVTRPDEANDWVIRLGKAGLGRIAAFTGETSAQQREQLLDEWDKNRLDGMVATSAFGLGVDKNDVRAVIHATLPESLDRFYQEVGRSGRDGKAAASLLLFTKEDVDQARDMASPTMIGNELGIDRWLAMIDHPVRPVHANGALWLDLNRLRARLTVHGKTNRLWNLRTLNLMASAGLIEITALSARSPESSVASEDDEYSDAQVAYAEVRIINPNHRNQDVFDRCMNNARNKLQKATDKAFRLMYQTATAQLEISEALVQLYGLALSDHWGPISVHCGGCSVHWAGNRLAPRELRPFVARMDHFTSRMDKVCLLDSLPHERSNLVLISVTDIVRACTDNRSVLALMLREVRPHTVLFPYTTSNDIVDGLIEHLTQIHSDAFVDHFDPREPTSLQGGSNEVRFVIWTESSITPEAAATLQSSSCAMTVIFLNEMLPDPHRQERPWISIVAHADGDTVLRKLII